MPKCIELSRTRTVADDIMDEQQRDCQQRIAGLRIFKYESEMTPATAQNSNGKRLYVIEPGFYYTVQITATRAGKPFGTYKAPKFFNSPDERDAFITRRIKLFWRHRRACNVPA